MRTRDGGVARRRRLLPAALHPRRGSCKIHVHNTLRTPLLPWITEESTGQQGREPETRHWRGQRASRTLSPHTAAFCSHAKMGSRQDQKHEKLLRELLKLPDNKRCPNCDSIVSRRGAQAPLICDDPGPAERRAGRPAIRSTPRGLQAPGQSLCSARPPEGLPGGGAGTPRLLAPTTLTYPLPRWLVVRCRARSMWSASSTCSSARCAAASSEWRAATAAAPAAACWLRLPCRDPWQSCVAAPTNPAPALAAAASLGTASRA